MRLLPIHDLVRWWRLGAIRLWRANQKRMLSRREIRFRDYARIYGIDHALYREAARHVIAGLVEENRRLRHESRVLEARSTTKLISALVQRVFGA